MQNFISFSENLEYYLSLEMTDGGVDENGYPIGLLNDVSVRGVHYDSFTELQTKWNERKERINYDNLFVIATEEFIATEDEKCRFDRLPFPKVCFVSHKQDIEYDWQVFLPGYEQNEQLGDIMVYCDTFGRRLCEKYFDFIYFLNNKQIKARGK